LIAISAKLVTEKTLSGAPRFDTYRVKRKRFAVICAGVARYFLKTLAHDLLQRAHIGGPDSDGLRSTFQYVVGQRIGSHHIHGTWPSLLFHYLEKCEGEGELTFVPRGDDCETHINQYMYVSLIVLRAMAAYVRHVMEPDEAKSFVELFESTEKEILTVYAAAIEDDT
jgi:hypothetical protein